MVVPVIIAVIADAIVVADSGNIGKRYRRNDAIGTPFCITYDFDSETDNCVTVRDRDTMEQTRVNINELTDYIKNKLEF